MAILAPMGFWRVVLMFLGIALCCTHCEGPARADQTDRELSRLCGPLRALAVANLVRLEARHHLLHPVLLARVVASESTCRIDADSGRGDIGLGQVRLGGSAARGHGRLDLLHPAINLHLAAAHLDRLLLLCGSWHGALRVYRGHRYCFR
jgi:hypothetical protein